MFNALVLLPRLSILDFLWRKSPKMQDKTQNGKPGFEAMTVFAGKVHVEMF